MLHDLILILMGAAAFGLSEVAVLILASRRRYDALQSGDDAGSAL